MQYYKLTTTKWLTRKPRYSYLKHQTDHKDHTHTRNYISMICNHKFVAQYRGIFARFSPAWHFPGVKSETPQKKRKRFSGVQALAAKKLVPNLWLGQSIPGKCDAIRRAVERSTILIQERKGNPWIDFLMVIMTSGTARVRTTTTTTTGHGGHIPANRSN